MRTASEILKLDWFLLERYNDFPKLVLYDFIFQRSHYFRKITGYYLDSALLYENGMAYTCFERTNFLRNKRFFFDLLVKNPSYFIGKYQKERQLHELWNFQTKKINRLIKHRSWKQLYAELKKWHELFGEIAMVGQPINVVEFDDAWLTEYLTKHKPTKQGHSYGLLLQLSEMVMEAKKVRYQLYLDYKNIIEHLAKTLAQRANQPQKKVLTLTFNELLVLLLTNKLSASKTKHNLDGTIFYQGQIFPLAARQTKYLIGKVTKVKNLGAKVLKGQPVMPGKVTGKVCVVLSRRDLKKMKKGQILVAHTTTADLMSAVHKASAIISDMGGITSHAAIVSRELGIPCVMGTKIATSVLKDGDMVEVDANKGIVRKINK